MADGKAGYPGNQIVAVKSRIPGHGCQKDVWTSPE